MIKIFKFKKTRSPSLKSLQPQIFNMDRLWFSALGVFLLILVITGLIGFWLFYSQYTESYKKETESTGNFENIMHISKLRNAIEKRNNFINAEISVPKDPSL